MKMLAKLSSDRWLFGVCSGIAYSVGAPTWLVRMLTVLLTLSTGVALVAYILLAIFMPKRSDMPADYVGRTNRWFEDANESKQGL